MREHQRLVAGERGELVLRLDERQPGLERHQATDPIGKLRMGVEPGAHGGAADGELVQARQRRAHRLLRLRELRHVARKFLAQRQRRGVLQVRAPDLHDACERVALGGKARREFLDRGQDVLVQGARRGDVHCGREHVVRRLPEVDLVVRVHQALLAALAAEQLRGAVGKHLVDIHVALRARSGLPHDQRELGVVPAGEHLAGRALNPLGLGFLEEPQLQIDRGGHFLDQRQAMDHLERHALAGDAEKAPAALGLRAPQARGGDLDRAE